MRVVSAMRKLASSEAQRLSQPPLVHPLERAVLSACHGFVEEGDRLATVQDERSRLVVEERTLDEAPPNGRIRNAGGAGEQARERGPGTGDRRPHGRPLVAIERVSER